MQGTVTTTQTRSYDPAGLVAALSNVTGTATTLSTLDWDLTSSDAQMLGLAGSSTNDMVRGPGGWISQRSGVAGSAIGIDQNGSVISTSIARAAGYGEFGEPLGGTSTFEPRLGYRGELMTDASLYLRARNYSPALGQFQTRDQASGRLGTPTISTSYQYADNGPLQRADPSGMYAVTDLSVDDHPRPSSAERESHGALFLFDSAPQYSDGAQRARLGSYYRGHGDSIHRAAIEASTDEFYLLAIYHKEGYAYNRAIPFGGAGQAAVDDAGSAAVFMKDSAKSAYCALPLVSCNPSRETGTRRGAFGLHEPDIASANETAARHGSTLGRNDDFNGISGNLALDARYAAWHFRTLRDKVKSYADQRGIPILPHRVGSGVAEYNIDDLASGTWYRGHTYVGLIDYWTTGGTPTAADHEGESYMQTVRHLRRALADG